MPNDSSSLVSPKKLSADTTTKPKSLSVTTTSSTTEKQKDVHVFGRHLIQDEKPQWSQVNDDGRYKVSKRKDSNGDSSGLDHNTKQEKDRKATDDSIQINPWRSKKPLYNDGPFTVKYPETRLDDFNDYCIDDYHVDMGNNPMGSFHEVLQSTNPKPLEWSRHKGKEQNDSDNQDDWCYTNQRANPYMNRSMESICVRPKPSEASFWDVQSLGLSDNQILGLRNLGFHIPDVDSHTNQTHPDDPRIPPSFEIAGALCWWCESPEHVSYGVARLLEDDPAFVGIDMEWRVRRNSKRYSPIALIQIAKIDTVLLIPTNFREQSAPKALHILFQDLNIVKVGVKVEENLLKLWRDIEIDANCYVELNELIPLASFDLGRINLKSANKLGLKAMCQMLDYPILKNREIPSSNWEKLPLSWNQLHYAALEALMPARIFWHILIGREIEAMKPISAADLRANIETFVNPVCKRLPISLLDKKQMIAKIKGDGFDLGCFWEHPYYCDGKSLANPGSQELSPTAVDNMSRDSSGFKVEPQIKASCFKPESQLEGDKISNFKGYFNEYEQSFGEFPKRRIGENDAIFQTPWKTYYAKASPYCGTGEEYTRVTQNCGFNLPLDKSHDLVN